MGKIRRTPASVATAVGQTPSIEQKKAAQMNGRIVNQQQNGMSTGVKLGCAFGALAVFAGIAWYAYTQRLNTPLAQEALPQNTLPQDPLSPKQLDLLATHLHAGYQIIEDGGCTIENSDLGNLKSASQCAEEFKYVKWAIDQQGLTSQLYSPEAYNNKGYKIIDYNTNEFYLLAMNPKIRECYKKGLVYANQEMRKAGFFDQPTDRILTVWKKIHKMIGQYSSDVGAGAYRPYNVCALVYAKAIPNGVTEYQARYDQLIEAGVNETETKFALKELFSLDYCDLSSRAKASISKIAGLTSLPKEISAKMTSLVERIKESVAKGADNIKLGADVHQELVRIHPWSDANGRFARLIMNMFLPDPVIFPDDADYTDAVSHAIDGLTSFEGYLRDKVIPWNHLAQPILMA